MHERSGRASPERAVQRCECPTEFGRGNRAEEGGAGLGRCGRWEGRVRREEGGEVGEGRVGEGGDER